MQEGSGSGFALYHYRLFEGGKDGLTELIRFPSEGRADWCCNYPQKKFSSRIVNCARESGRTRVEVEFSLTYTINNRSDEKILLFDKTQKAIYKSAPGTSRPLLDPVESDVTQQEIDNVYVDVSDAADEAGILKQHFLELQKIAAGRDVERREWLRRFLQGRKDSHEKAVLLNLLRAK